ncbi:MAG: hypothetical protein OXE81_00375 [Gammaproteobacteria bacterium]|nr:hypothetical protein [Gammaproteobacteria bacterium]
MKNNHFNSRNGVGTQDILTTRQCVNDSLLITDAAGCLNIEEDALGEHLPYHPRLAIIQLIKIGFKEPRIAVARHAVVG